MSAIKDRANKIRERAAAKYIAAQNYDNAIAKLAQLSDSLGKIAQTLNSTKLEGVVQALSGAIKSLDKIPTKVNSSLAYKNDNSDVISAITQLNQTLSSNQLKMV